MTPLPSQDMRKNRNTWAVRPCQVPAVAHFMHDALPNEKYDPHFVGQAIKTVYFDTPKLELRKNRRKHDKYITLRLRCYKAPYQDEVYAISAKTEEEKFRVEIPSKDANRLLNGEELWADYLPANFMARLLDVSHGELVVPVVRISAQRYAIEDSQDRFTLDTDIKTDTGKAMPYAVLEYKSTENDGVWTALDNIGLYPIKLSKFLWATSV